MATISERITRIRTTIPDGVNLVCVSKFHPTDAIREAYDAGERHFGESRVQELLQKVPLLPSDICWHFIGHLQSNKVRDLLRVHPYLVESVDSLKLLQTIQKEAATLNIVQDVLLEVHVANEQTKSGFLPEELSSVISRRSDFPNVRVRGIMSMATNTDDEAEIRRCFRLTASLACGPVISMGMSDDYHIAIECGSTNVRIGSAIFGERSVPTKSLKLPKAVFFDQDGVLFNSMPYHAQSWELAMQENGLPFTKEQTYRNEGRTGASVINEAHQLVYGAPASQQLIETVYSAKSAHFIRLTGGKLPELIPGIRAVLDYLRSRDVSCWVVTGSGQRSLIDNLHKTFPDIFDGVITAFDVKHGKPDPEPYLKAWERSGFKKEECAVVENAPLGVRAGKAAGLYTIAVNTGPLPDEMLLSEGADRVFPSMQALLDWLKAL